MRARVISSIFEFTPSSKALLQFLLHYTSVPALCQVKSFCRKLLQYIHLGKVGKKFLKFFHTTGHYDWAFSISVVEEHEGQKVDSDFRGAIYKCNKALGRLGLGTK